MALEDDFCDMVKKSRMGQGLSVADVARKADIPTKDLEILEKGNRAPTPTEVESLGETLQLKTNALTDIAIHGWVPQQSPGWVEEQVVTVRGDIGGYEVKGYILYDFASKKAAFIDTAYNAEEMLGQLTRRALTLTGMCLTHGHADHAGGLDRILAEWPVPVYLGEGDFPLLPWKPPPDRLCVPSDGQRISVGQFTIECVATPGHTPGGYCYKVQNNGHALCFVGDTLFAGSIGRSNPFSLYVHHLASVRARVLKMSENTVLLPGHGPATTVQEEVVHNPFG